MAARKPLFMGSEGFSEEMAITDSMTLGGLTMGGNIAMGTYKVTGIGDGADPQDAVSLQQLNDAIIAGGTVKELLFDQSQLDDTDGIYALEVLTFDAQPVSGDLVTIKDGTTERSYGAAAGGDVQYAIGGTAAISMQNLVDAINGDGSATWAAEFRATEHPDINADGVIVITENFTAAGDTTSRLFGVWATQANVQVVEYAAGGTIDGDYSDETVVTMPATDPAEARFGLRRQQSALTAGEMHFVRTDDTLYSWDDDDSTWQIMSGPSSIPDATAASGGGVKGKITVDSDLGLAVASGVLSIDLSATPGLEFSSGDLQVKADTTAGIELTASGVAIDIGASTPGVGFDGSGDLVAKADTTAGIELTATGIAIDLGASNPGLQFDGSGDLEVLANTSAGLEIGASGVGIDIHATTPGLEFDGTSGIRVKWAGDKGIIVTANGVEIEIDDTPDTLDVDGDGLKVVGLPSLFKINDTAVGALVTAANLDTLTDGSSTTLHSHPGVSEAERVENQLNCSEDVAKGDPLYMSGSDTVGKADAGTDAKARVIGIAKAAATSGNPVEFISMGEAAGVGSGWTANDPVYLADGGGLTTTIPAAAKRVVLAGYAMTAADLFVHHMDYGKKAA